MREIKFRGKRIGNDDFVYGDLIHGVGNKNGKIYILPLVVNLASLPGCHPLDGYEVEPATVGQYTGLKDKNGITEIYEGDIVRYELPDEIGKDVTVYVESVEFIEGTFCVDGYVPVNCIDDWNGEVIGNIHQNPELLNS